MSRGSFTISLDFELFWGVRANRKLEDYEGNLLGVYSAIPKMLDLFEKYDIHATWATVGFLFHKEIKEIKENRPSIVPEYKNREVDPYIYLDTLDSEQSKEFSRMHCSLDLIEAIAKSPNQEIGTHTYSHFFTYEALSNKEAFSVDMKQAVKVAEERGYRLKSLVFPRNQLDTQAIDTLEQLPISSYRGNPAHWAYCDGDKPNKLLLLRLYRLVDTYLNLSGYHTTLPRASKGVIELKASMMLRPYFAKLSYLERFKIYRIKRAMKYAATHGQNFHLWWHPHNFGDHQDKNLQNLEELLKYFQELHLKYEMDSLTMDEVNKYVNKQ